MHKNDIKLSVVIPVFNEESVLDKSIRDIIRELERSALSYEIIIVENGSTDKTSDMLNRIAGGNNNIKCFHLNKPSYGKALIKGLLSAKGRFIVIFNIDFWDKKFISLANCDLLGYDIVAGSKNLPASKDLRPVGRRITTKLLTVSLKLLFGYEGTDSHGIKILRAKTTTPIIKKCMTKSGIFDSEFIIRSQKSGLKILELPVEIMEIRPNRFGLKRIFDTPKDMFSLYTSLKND